MIQEQAGAVPSRGRSRRAAALLLAAAPAAALLLPAALARPARGQAAAADPLPRLVGRWASEPDGAFAMTWSAAGDGFGLRWTVPGGGEAEAAFAPSGRPGVFAAAGGDGWSMFGGGKPANPLVGGTLRWARVGGDTVYVYSLSVQDRGAFVLDRYACRLAAGDRLEVAFQRRRPADRVEELRLTLARSKG